MPYLPIGYCVLADEVPKLSAAENQSGHASHIIKSDIVSNELELRQLAIIPMSSGN
jgi:hypothetical protein